MRVQVGGVAGSHYLASGITIGISSHSPFTATARVVAVSSGFSPAGVRAPEGSRRTDSAPALDEARGTAEYRASTAGVFPPCTDRGLGTARDPGAAMASAPWSTSSPHSSSCPARRRTDDRMVSVMMKMRPGTRDESGVMRAVCRLHKVFRPVIVSPWSP